LRPLPTVSAVAKWQVSCSECMGAFVSALKKIDFELKESRIFFIDFLEKKTKAISICLLS